MALEEAQPLGGVWGGNSAGGGSGSGAWLEGYDLEKQFGRCAACHMTRLG